MTSTTYHALGGAATPASANLESQLKTVHGAISSRYPGIDRVALAAYDPRTDALKTFVSSNRDGMHLDHYEAKLQNVPSLKVLADGRMSRVVDDIDTSLAASTQHTDWLKRHAYRSSLTVPIFKGNQLAGFLFFDSKQPHFFSADMTEFLEMFSHLIAQLYLLQLQVVSGMVGTVQMASGLSRIRDLETGQHLERMAAYSHLMALKLAESHSLTDEFIEYVFLFAPLHDVGKVGIPDRVLLKPGKLDGDEWVIMRRHVAIGESIVVQMGCDLQMENGLAFDVMRNIVTCHHERGDGSGYPHGLLMDQIPLEARIVAVADVYDALSNVRPYKPAWTEAHIIQELDQEVASGRLDGECVRVLMEATAERARIQLQFADRP
ncbi:GAF and HD-GYP domain-containing protein [Rhodoferax aquaticus]|uniref:HD domain-containing protein n=1 Tax=Rhodoferax aquaticus TaxID=2527691 RepID=A0A515ENL2_9BURK|nr:HD domain-containing phosphohydrolase [Rhodoferax aquaticus]QDL54252.1 HD domain-containing protein [Rhodoferax aquaticus]